MPPVLRWISAVLVCLPMLGAGAAGAYPAEQISFVDFNRLRLGLGNPVSGALDIMRTPRVDGAGAALIGPDGQLLQHDWLPPLETAGKGAGELAAYFDRGWRHASESEVCALLEASSLGPVPCPMPHDQLAAALVPFEPAALRIPFIVFLGFASRASYAQTDPHLEYELCSAFVRGDDAFDPSAGFGLVRFIWSEDPAREHNAAIEVDSDGDGELDSVVPFYIEASLLPAAAAGESCWHPAGQLLVRDAESAPAAGSWPAWRAYARSQLDWEAAGQRAGSRPIRQGGEVVGVGFRVWAPRACRVAVVDRDSLPDDFEIDDASPGWSGYLVPEDPPPACASAATPHIPDCECLRASEDAETGLTSWGGYWSADVGERVVPPDLEAPGLESAYQLLTAIIYEDQPWLRRDPRGVVVEHAPTYWSPTYVYDHDAFDWQGQLGASQGDLYVRPRREEIVELNVEIGELGDNVGAEQPTFAGAIPGLDFYADLGLNMLDVGYLHTRVADLIHYYMSDPFAVRADRLDFESENPADGLKQLVREAHRRGIGIATELAYVQWDLAVTQNFDGWVGGPERSAPDGCNALHRAAGSFHLDNRHARNQVYKGWYLDFAEPAVADLLVDNARDWVMKFGIDKFRLDSSVDIRFGDIGVPAADGRCTSNPGVVEDMPGGLALSRRLAQAVRETGAYIMGEEWTWGYCPSRPCPDPVAPASKGGVGYDMIQWNAEWVRGRGFRTTIELIDDTGVANPDHMGKDEWDAIRELLDRHSAAPFALDVSMGWGPERFNPVEVIHESDPDHAAKDWHRDEVRRLLQLFSVLYLTVPQYPKIHAAMLTLENEYARVFDPAAGAWRRAARDELVSFFPGQLRFIRDLLALRTDQGGPLSERALDFYRGKAPGAAAGPALVAYRRWSGDRADGGGAVVVLNTAGETRRERVSLPHAGVWMVRMNTSRWRYGEFCLPGSRRCENWGRGFHPRGPRRVVRARRLADASGEPTLLDGFGYGSDVEVGAYGALILTCSAFVPGTETCCRDANVDGVCDPKGRPRHVHVEARPGFAARRSR